MQYRKFGKTGMTVSALGFGAMRLPHIENVILEDESIPLIHRAFELGVNYIDTALAYGESELVIGKAIKKFPREKIYISTKNPTRKEDITGKTWRRKLEISLKRLQVSYIDLYVIVHDLRFDLYEETKGKPYSWIAEAQKAKKEGLFKHAIFSSHDKPENIIKMIEEIGYIEGLIIQYNLLDRVNEPVIEYAYKNGVGIATMGSVGGGRLGEPSAEIQALIPGGSKSTAEVALRFVLSNPWVSCALSGMNTIEMVEENCATASREDHLTPEEKNRIHQVMEEKKKLADLYCTGCKYCMPCPNNVRIPEIFSAYNCLRIYGLKDYSIGIYKRILKFKVGADMCKECRKCEEKCPQKIKIVEQLKEAHTALTAK